MNDLFERVRGRVSFSVALARHGTTVGDAGRFKNTQGAVCLRLRVFWQGVDVPGDQLSCVIVDRLPFAVPSDPIVAARVKALQEDGRNAFSEFQVPQAVLSLKQVFGAADTERKPIEACWHCWTAVFSGWPMVKFSWSPFLDMQPRRS